MSREFFRTMFAIRKRKANSRTKHAGYARTLRAEELELRYLLSASLPEMGQATSIVWQGHTVQAAKDQWLVQLNATPSANFLSSLTNTFGNSAAWYDVNAQVHQGLVTSPGATVQQFTSWAQGRSDVSVFEPDFVGGVSVIPNDSVFANESTVDGLWGMNNQGQDQLQWNPTTSTSSGSFGGTGVVGAADADIDAPEAWNITTGSTKVVIGVIDTGIDYTHPDLYLNIWVNQAEIPSGVATQLADVDGDGLFTFRDFNNSANRNMQLAGKPVFADWNANGYIDGGDLLRDADATNDIWENGGNPDGNGLTDDIIGWNFVNNTNDPLDDHLHGTHVAGTIGAVGNNSIGVAGVNWNVSLIPVKFLDSGGGGDEARAMQAIDYTTQLRTLGVNVVATNDSWGGFGPSALISAAIGRAAAQDVLFVAAAGNASINDDDFLFTPAADPNDHIISVAATDSFDNRSIWSATGSSHYGQSSVDLGAPGTNILSTFPTYTTFAMNLGGAGLSTYYETISGTSMATPHVTGVIALMAAYNQSATGMQLKNAVLDSVDVVPDLAGKTVTGGRLNAASALAAIKGTTYVVSTNVDENDGNYSTGDLSLREALALAATQTTGTDTILFDAALAGTTIALTSSLGQLVIDSNVTIKGLGMNQLTIDAGGHSRVLQVNSGIKATIRGLGIADGSSFSYSAPGGGIFNQGQLTLDEVDVHNNIGGLGGGIAQQGTAASLRIIDSNLRNNTATTSGGALYATGGSIDITTSTINNNNASLYTGGLWLSGSSSSPINLAMKNSTVSSNGMGGLSIGGGAYASANIVSSTFTLNTPPYPDYGQPQEGGGIISSALTKLTNTIVAGNTAGDIKGYFLSTSDHNLIGEVRSAVNIANGTNGNQVGTQASPIDAKLSALGDFGGPTKTHALQANSPALDAGGNSGAVGLAGDQRGTLRIAGAAVDIGAFERGPLVVSTPRDEAWDGNIDLGDFSLREALYLSALLPGDDQIQFDPAMYGATTGLFTGHITLDNSLGELLINSNVTISGPGAAQMTIDRNGSSRVIEVSAGVVATVSGVKLTGGNNYSQIGGGVLNHGNLTLDHVIVSNNSASQGGGIAQDTTGASLHLVGTAVSSNSAMYSGGGIYVTAGDLYLQSSTLNNNSAITLSQGGGILFASSGVDQITNSTISTNSGEGLRTSGGTTTLLNSTIASNT
jgi:predicted outer membrane repeat protein